MRARTMTIERAVAALVVAVMGLLVVAVAVPAAQAQTDPYTECVEVDSGLAGNRQATDPYSECPPGTEPNVIIQSSEPAEDRVLGTRILPFTGAGVLGFIALGLGAIGVGVVLARKKRARESQG